MKETKIYRACKHCGREMSPRNGCKFSRIEVDGQVYKRIRVGDTGDFLSGLEKSRTCSHCNAGMGQFHHLGCDAERCPVCGGQLIGCDCLDSDNVFLLC